MTESSVSPSPDQTKAKSNLNSAMYFAMWKKSFKKSCKKYFINYNCYVYYFKWFVFQFLFPQCRCFSFIVGNNFSFLSSLVLHFMSSSPFLRVYWFCLCRGPGRGIVCHPSQSPSEVATCQCQCSVCDSGRSFGHCVWATGYRGSGGDMLRETYHYLSLNEMKQLQKNNYRKPLCSGSLCCPATFCNILLDSGNYRLRDCQLQGESTGICEWWRC